MAVFRKESELVKQQKRIKDTSALKFDKGAKGAWQRKEAFKRGYNPITGKKSQSELHQTAARWGQGTSLIGHTLGDKSFQQSMKGTGGAQYSSKQAQENREQSLAIHNVIGGTVLKAFGVNVDADSIIGGFQSINQNRQANQQQKKVDSVLDDKSGYATSQENIGVSPIEAEPLQPMAEEDNGGMVSPADPRFKQVVRPAVSSTTGSVITNNPDGTTTTTETKPVMRNGGKIKSFAGGGKFYYSKGGKFIYGDGGKVKDKNVGGASVADENVKDAPVETPKGDGELDVNELKAGLAWIETGKGKYENPYAVVNESGDRPTYATGKYQYLPRWHHKAIKKFAIKEGIEGFEKGLSKDEVMKKFAENPKLQESYTDDIIMNEYVSQAKSKRFKEVLAQNGMQDTIALLHFAGNKAVADYNKALKKDPNAYFKTPEGGAPNVSTEKYLSEFKKGTTDYKTNVEEETALQEGKLGTVQRLDDKGNIINVPIGDKSGGAYSAKNLPTLEIEGKHGMNMGGITKGKFSHKDNPLAVVDKDGNHTGMELTGEEGVFDKNAMNKIESLAKKGKFGALGKFIKKEMSTWENTGSAGAGADLSEWYDKVGDDESIVAIKEGIHAIESKGVWKDKPYEAINNTSSATGKYQFLWDLHGGNIKKHTGVSSKEEFLKNPEAQEKFMTWHIKNSLIPAAKKLKRNNPDIDYTHEELMALAHFQGAAGADIFIKTGKDQGGDNVDVSEYISTFNKGYEAAGGQANSSEKDYLSATDVLGDDATEEEIRKWNNIKAGKKYNSEGVKAIEEAYSKIGAEKLSEEEQTELKILNRELADLDKAIKEYEETGNLMGYDSKEAMEAAYKKTIGENMTLRGKIIESDYNRGQSIKNDVFPLVEPLKKELKEKLIAKEISQEDYDNAIGEINSFYESSNLLINNSTDAKEKFGIWKEAYDANPEGAYSSEVKKKEFDFHATVDNNNTAMYDDVQKQLKRQLENLKKERTFEVSLQGEHTIKQGLGTTELDVDSSPKIAEMDAEIARLEEAIGFGDKVIADKNQGSYEQGQEILQEMNYEKLDKLDDEVLKYDSTDTSLQFNFGKNFSAAEEERQKKIEEEALAEKDEDDYDDVSGTSSEDADLTTSQAPVSTMTSDEVARLQRENWDSAKATGLDSAIASFGGVDGALQLVGMAQGYKAATNPVPEQKKSEQWMEQIQRTKDRMNLGLDPNTKTMYQRDAERTYSYDAANIGRMATSGQSALAALGTASSRKYQSDLKMASMDATAREQHFADYQSAIVRDEAMTQSMWERNEYNEASRKRDLKAGLIGQSVKNIRDNAMYEKSYGDGSAYSQLMRAKLAETKATNKATQDSMLYSRGVTQDVMLEADKINANYSEEEQSVGGNTIASVIEKLGSKFKKKENV